MEVVNGLSFKFHISNFTKGLYNISRSDQPLGRLLQSSGENGLD